MKKITRTMCNYISTAFPKKLLIAQFVFTFVVILPLICYNLPWSVYFRPHERNYAAYLSRNEDEKRTALAETYLGHKNKNHDFPYQYRTSEKFAKEDVDHPSVAVAFLAVDRNRHEIDHYEPHYLSQSLVGIFKALDLEQRDYGHRFSQFNISVCNADIQPVKFGEAKRMEKYVPVMSRSLSELSKLEHLSKGCIECLAKSNLAFCLRKVSERYSEFDFIVILEDDMVAQIDFASALFDILTVRLKKRFRNNILKRLGYVQLHSPIRHYTYSLWDGSTWAEVFVMSSLGTFILITFFYRFHLRPYNLPQNLALCMLLFVYCTAVMLLIGRQHWLGARHAITRHYSLSDPIVSGFSAALLPRRTASELADFLDTTSHTTTTAFVDSNNVKYKHQIIDAFMEENKKRIFAVYPSLVKHIGLYSSYHKRIIDPYELDV